MSHTCNTCLVRCIDFRLGHPIHNFLEEQKLYGDADIISVAGACKGLNDERGGFLENQIDLSKRLHQINTIVLMNHMDCGAYGGHAAFHDAATERAHHLSELNKAKQFLESKYPGINVKIALAEEKFCVSPLN